MEQKTEMGKGAVLARPKTSAPKVWDNYSRKAEELAVFVESEFNGHCHKLRDLKPQGEAAREAFKTLSCDRGDFPSDRSNHRQEWEKTPLESK